eukprot:1160772-Pelagomonas_calceolata.AAC.3
MNPVDHPHGGGEGRAPIGHSRPLTPWGRPALEAKDSAQTTVFKTTAGPLDSSLQVNPSCLIKGRRYAPAPKGLS